MKQPPKRPTWVAITVESERHQIPLSVSSHEYELLDMYVSQCEALVKTRWVANGMPVGVKLNYEVNHLDYVTDLPSPEVVAEVLHRSRPFLLQNEPASFLRTCGLVGRLLPDAQIHAFLKTIRGKYQGLRFQQVVKITTSGPSPEAPDEEVAATLNSLDSMLEWLNAYEYHQDLDKRRRLESLTRLLSNDASRAIFLGMLAEALDASLQLGDLVALVTGHGSRLELRAPRAKPTAQQP